MVRSIRTRSTWPAVCRGFTLIELLVVFTLLALLLTLAAPKYFTVIEAGREKARAQNLATLRDAIDKFKADQGRFPEELAELVSKQYLRQVPVDPVSGSSEWVRLAAPSGNEPGVYDVAPPDQTATAPAETAKAPAGTTSVPAAGSSSQQP